VEVFEFLLPDGNSLTATSQKDLDEKVERHEAGGRHRSSIGPLVSASNTDEVATLTTS
jgi:hypothetical protein